MVKAKCELSDGPKNATLHIANIKANEMVDSIEDDSEQDILPESRNEEPIRPQKDSVTPAEGSCGPSTRFSESDRMRSSDISGTCHSRAWNRKEVTLPLNRMTPPWRWRMIDPNDEILSQGHGVSQMHALDYFMWMFSQADIASIVS